MLKITETAFSPGPRTDRLVASELERRWNAALAVVETLEKDLDAMVRQRPAALSAEEISVCCNWVLTWRQLGIIRRRPPPSANASSAQWSVTLQIVVARALPTATAPRRCARHTAQTLSGHQSAASHRNLERRTRRPSGSAYPSSAGTCDEVAARFFFFYWPSGVYPPNRTVVRALTVASRKISKRYRL